MELLRNFGVGKFGPRQDVGTGEQDVLRENDLDLFVPRILMDWVGDETFNDLANNVVFDGFNSGERFLTTSYVVPPRKGNSDVYDALEVSLEYEGTVHVVRYEEGLADSPTYVAGSMFAEGTFGTYEYLVPQSREAGERVRIVVFATNNAITPTRVTRCRLREVPE